MLPRRPAAGRLGTGRMLTHRFGLQETDAKPVAGNDTTRQPTSHTLEVVTDFPAQHERALPAVVEPACRAGAGGSDIGQPRTRAYDVVAHPQDSSALKVVLLRE